MGTIRRGAIAALGRLEVDAKALRRYIEIEMDDELGQRQMQNYLDRARVLRHHLDYLDKQLSNLKDIVK